MAEVESSAGSVRMAMLISGVATGEKLKRRSLEDDCAGGGSLKFKRRKVGVNRDFPRDFGRISERMNEVLKEGDGKPKVAEENGAMVELEPFEDSESFGGFLESESSNARTSETTEASGKLESLSPLVTSISQDLDSDAGKVEELETVKAVECETGSSKSLASDSETAKPLGTSGRVKELEMECETGSSKSLAPDAEATSSDDQVEELEMMKLLEHATLARISPALDSDVVKHEMEVTGTANVDSEATVLPVHSGRLELTELSKTLEPQHKSATGLVSPESSVLAKPSDVSKVSNRPQRLLTIVEDAVQRRLTLKISRKRALVIRDFPQGCGRNSHTSSGDYAIQTNDKISEGGSPSDRFKGKVTREIGYDVGAKSVKGFKMAERVQVRTTSPTKTNLFRLDSHSQLDSDGAIKEARFQSAKLVEEVKSSRDKTPKRDYEIKVEVGDINQSRRMEIVSFEPSAKDAVLALMAEPFCPWRKGKTCVTSNPTIRKARSKAKKQKLAVVVHKRTATIFKSNRAEAENRGENSKGKQASSIELDSYYGLGHFVPNERDQEYGNVVLDKKPPKFEVSPIPFVHHISRGIGDGAKVTREKVRETLRLFQVIFRKFLHGEETHPKGPAKAIRRIDIHASSILKNANKWVNTEKFIGPVSGVEVGDEFQYRVELAMVGLHGPFQSGIETVNKDGRLLATSVIASGGYPDDMDNSDVLIYTGQGGRPMSGKKLRQAEDQKLRGGNLALKNSMDAGTVVRVTRGFKDMSSSDSVNPNGKITMTYTYDGLYIVEDCWTESSSYGTSIFKFKLKRISGQPELAWKELTKSRKSKVREGLCVIDISQGKEKMLVGAVNTIDDEKPQPFTYITKMKYPDWYNPVSPQGCDCTNGCLDPKICSCAAKNGGEIRFNHNGAIVEAKPLVYECGPSCRCPPSCCNRVSQHGIKFQLEVFKTNWRGWGVRSMTSIPSGSFVCEYTGELLQDQEAEKRTGNDEYLFDIGNNYNDHTLWEGLTSVMPDLQPSSCEVVEDAGYTIDAAQYGSVGRFINHSCSPNLYAQNVLYDHDDKRMPHIMLFAAENIPPLKELTYHYNYTIGQVFDAEGNVKEKKCYCGSAECSGRLY